MGGGGDGGGGTGGGGDGGGGDVGGGADGGNGGGPDGGGGSGDGGGGGGSSSGGSHVSVHAPSAHGSVVPVPRRSQISTATRTRPTTRRRQRQHQQNAMLRDETRPPFTSSCICTDALFHRDLALEILRRSSFSSTTDASFWAAYTPASEGLLP